MNKMQYEKAISLINESSSISFEESFELSKLCAKLLRIDDQAQLGRNIIIRIHDVWEKLDDSTRIIWNDLTEAAGLYPYVNANFLSDSGQIRHEFHKSPYLDEHYLHSEQQKLSLDLFEKKSVVLSAPTSFGKSLLIEEVIASRIYKNIVVIQPTLALLDETRKKLHKYKNFYKIIVSTSQAPDNITGNIFLFTAERVVDYRDFPKVDFFVIDEFYKLSLEREDDRAIVLNKAFHRLLQFTTKFYMLGPVVKNIPMSFKERFELVWHPTNYATVVTNEIDLSFKEKLPKDLKSARKKAELFKILISSQPPTLIYCSSPKKATDLALEFSNYLSESKVFTSLSTDNEIVIEWISENLNPKWTLVDALKLGIGFHHGALPRHLGSSMVDLFNNGSILWLFCTSTLIEGVNTSAKNVILFDQTKGRKKIDFFDYKNIAGRSGRMKRHFVGNVLSFEKQPDSLELDIDIPLFSQENAPVEILLFLNEDEIENIGRERLKEFNNLPNNLKKVIKENIGFSLDGQLKIISEISSNINKYSNLLVWNSYPKFNQLNAVIELAWKYLLKPNEGKADVRNARHLSVLTMKYSQHKSVPSLINSTINDPYWIERYPSYNVRINEATFFILNIIRHWFDFKLPKLLSTISGLQSYVFESQNIQSGNYAFYAKEIENGFLPSDVNLLTEYDVPPSAINKLLSALGKNISASEITSKVTTLTDEELKSIGLIQYEINKIRTVL